MKNKNRKAEDILRDALGVRKSIREELKKQREKQGSELTEKQRRKIINKVKGKYRMGKSVAIFLLGLGITMNATKALPSGDEITPPKSVAENKAGREEFVTELKFENDNTTIKIIDIDKQNKEIKDYIKSEIKGLETEEDVLNYIKTFYINEYNDYHETDYSVEQLKIMRERDLAPEGIITASIQRENGTIYDSVVKDWQGYHTCIVRDDEIIMQEADFLVDVAPVIDTGISYMASMNNEQTLYDLKVKYKENFINEMSDYVVNYKGKTYEIAKENIAKEKELKEGNEIGE